MKIIQTGSTSKCRNALVFDFISQSRFYFILTLDMYILDLQVRCLTSLKGVTSKMLIELCMGACNL